MASLRSTTSVGEQAYSDHVDGRPATTGQSKQGAQWSHSHSAFACHHWFGQTETETLVMTRISWGAQVAQTSRRAYTDVFELFLDTFLPKINETVCHHRLCQAVGILVMTHVSPTI